MRDPDVPGCAAHPARTPRPDLRSPPTAASPLEKVLVRLDSGKRYSAIATIGHGEGDAVSDRESTPACLYVGMRQENTVERMQRTLGTAALFGGLVLCASSASAQTPFQRNIDVQQWRPAAGPFNFLTTEGSRVNSHMGISFGAYLNYSYRPFTIYNADCPNPDNDDNCRPSTVRSRPVEPHATQKLIASVSLFRRLQIALDIPVSLENGDLVSAADARPTTNPATSQTGVGLGDPRLYLKGRLVGEGLSGPGLAISGFVQAPLGRYAWNRSSVCTGMDDSCGAFLGDNSVVFGLRVIGDFRRGPFAMAANAGVILRPDTLQILSSYVGNRITWSVAGSYDITPRITGVLEFYGSTDLTRPNVIQQNVIEGDLAARYRMGDLSFSLGGGSGILRGVGSPVARAFLGVAYAPYRVDTDSDGVYDDVDRCPTEREDRDGFEDADGCPDPDNDGDGLNDDHDRCPNAPEDRDHFQDEDGCPDPDNDGDGILDGYDTCPMQPEDRDGDRDDDGCPDDDRDRDGIADARDRCPTEPEDTDGFEDEDGCPEPDNDRDGVPDTTDQCSEQPETMNGYQDDDGCPDAPPDRDHDGIVDGADHCPDQPETYNGVDDEDGCPERGRSLVSLEGGQIRILQQVNFATNSDRIVGARSFQVLDSVAAVLRAHPELPHVEVQGHTDDRGNADANRDLSNRRAAAVVAYLSAHGIDSARLNSRGFGPDVPVVPNTNARNRAQNRRVEFHIEAASVQGNTISEPAPSGASTTPAASQSAAPAAAGTSASPAAH